MMGLHVLIPPSIPYIFDISLVIKERISILVSVVMVVAWIPTLAMTSIPVTTSVSPTSPGSSSKWVIWFSVIIQGLV